MVQSAIRVRSEMTLGTRVGPLFFQGNMSLASQNMIGRSHDTASPISNVTNPSGVPVA
jgi:hypothetical protein